MLLEIRHFSKKSSALSHFGLPMNVDEMSGESEELNRDIQKDQREQQPK